MEREAQILENLPMVERIAAVVARKAGRPDLYEELVQEGALALVDAVDGDIRDHHMVRITDYPEVMKAVAERIFEEPGTIESVLASYEVERIEREEC